MSDKATLKVSLNAPGLLPFAMHATGPHQSKACGAIDVPADTPAGTEVDIPFGSVRLDATLVVVSNRTSLPVDAKINGVKTHSIPPSGFVILGSSEPNTGTSVKSFAVVTTAKHDKSEKIEFFVFGDAALAS